jgi:hypothetical protein
MLLSLNLLLVYLSSGQFTEATQALAQRRGLSTIPPRETAAFNRAEATTIDKSPQISALPSHGVIEERQSVPQYFFAVCPEEMFRPPKPCVDCGGDTVQEAVCDNMLLVGRQSSDCLLRGQNCVGYYCACTPDGVDPSNGINSTAVVSGQTGTICFVPVTYSEYSLLQATTTVTVTEPVSTVDGGEAMETGEVVIYPGGAAWGIGCKFSLYVF